MMCVVRTGTIGRWEKLWKYDGAGGRQVGLGGGAVGPLKVIAGGRRPDGGWG